MILNNPGLIFSILLFLILSACTSADDTLNATERYMADTLYNARLATYKAEADSLCRIWQDSIFDASVDSILNERLDEIELLTGSRELLHYSKKSGENAEE